MGGRWGSFSRYFHAFFLSLLSSSTKSNSKSRFPTRMVHGSLVSATQNSSTVFRTQKIHWCFEFEEQTYSLYTFILLLYTQKLQPLSPRWRRHIRNTCTREPVCGKRMLISKTLAQVAFCWWPLYKRDGQSNTQKIKTFKIRVDDWFVCIFSTLTHFGFKNIESVLVSSPIWRRIRMFYH